MDFYEEERFEPAQLFSMTNVFTKNSSRARHRHFLKWKSHKSQTTQTRFAICDKDQGLSDEVSHLDQPQQWT